MSPIDEDDDSIENESGKSRFTTKIHDIFEPSLEHNAGSEEFISNTLKGLHPMYAQVLEACWKTQIDTLNDILGGFPGDIKKLINCQDNDGRTPLMIASGLFSIIFI